MQWKKEKLAWFIAEFERIWNGLVLKEEQGISA